jgi:hypothetical protein
MNTISNNESALSVRSKINNAIIDVNNKIPLTQKGVANGVATLDGVGKLPSAQLPTITKSDVGLSNIDNTSDLNKPISTATMTALNTKISSSGPTTVVNLWQGTQAQYTALGTYNNNTLYFIA